MGVMSGPRDALEAKGFETRRAKIPGGHCTGLLEREPPPDARQTFAYTSWSFSAGAKRRTRAMNANRMSRWTAATAAFGLALGLTAPVAAAAEKTDFKVCWSIYVGWMPWGQIQDSGLMKKWADKYGITVDIVQINDYVESINQ